MAIPPEAGAFVTNWIAELTVTSYYFFGILCPFAAKAFPKAVFGPPPAGFTWQRPHGNFVSAEY